MSIEGSHLYSQNTLIASLKGFNLKLVFAMKGMRKYRHSYVECEAFSSNHRAWRMAARALCSTLMSTSEKRTDNVQVKNLAPQYKSTTIDLGRVLQWSSGSSLRRLGGTVVMRIFTVASAELISNPVSLVSIDSTKADKGIHGTPQSYRTMTANSLSVYWSLYSPSAGSWVRRVSTTLFPNAATASTATDKRFYFSSTFTK